MSITVKPLSDALGASITGVDLSEALDPDTVKAIWRAWLDNIVLVFPGQSLSEEDQERFCGYFGELEVVRKSLSQDQAHPSVMLITNVKDTGKVTALEDGEMMFHYDQCYYEYPGRGSFLYAMEIPREGGNTLFANCVRAYETLSDDWKKRIGGLRALNYYDYNRDPTARPTDLRPDAPQWIHPIVRTHPETGRKALYVNRLMTVGIEDVKDDEGEEILTYLFDYIENPAFIYEHKWTVGDLLMWDNRCSEHARTYFSPKEPRMMRRISVKEPAPVV